MATTSALVVASGAAAAEDAEELPVDLSQLPQIPAAKSLLLVNNFVANTTRFLNHFAFECEERISRVSSNLTRVEIMLAILEAKLNSIPDLAVSDADVQAAGQSMAGGSAGLPPADQIDIGISDQDLPSMDAGVPAPPPPPPPPPAEDGGIVPFEPPPPPPMGSGDLVVAPPPPPGSDFDDDDEEDNGPVAPDDLLPQAEAQPTFLKLKDDPVYAKYFTMRRLGMPDQIIEHKLMMDGMDPGILHMDPEGPSPSGGTAPTASEPTGPILPIMAPPSVMSDSDSDSDDDDHVGGLPPPPPPPPASVTSERPPSGNIGLPFPPPPPPISPTSSVASRPESLFGGLPPPPRAPGMGGLPPPPLPPFDPNDEDSSSDDDIEEIVADPAPSEPGFLKLKDDPAFDKYFKMRKLGMPDAVIQHKLTMDGVTVDILNMDPEGPSPNGSGGAPPASAPAPAAAPPSALPPPPLPPAGRPGLPPPPIPKYTGSDDDSDFDSD